MTLSIWNRGVYMMDGLKNKLVITHKSPLTWIWDDQVPAERIERTERRARGVPRSRQSLRASTHGVVVDQIVREFGRELGRDVGEVLLGRHHAGRVVHFDLEVGQRVEQWRVGHGDFIGDVVESVNGTSVHGRGRRQVGRCRQKISCRGKIIFTYKLGFHFSGTDQFFQVRSCCFVPFSRKCESLINESSASG